MMQDVADEDNHLIYRERCYWLVLDPLGKLVDSTNTRVKPPGTMVRGPIMSRPQHANGHEGGMMMRL
jgi:hypothetical protein